MSPSRILVRTLLCAAATATAGAALAQTSASPYTWATRYDAERRVTGTIAPDPDSSGPIRFGAVRNSYDANGWLVKVEHGELATWQSEAVAPANWAGFTVFRTVDMLYDDDGRKIRELVSSGGTIHSRSEASYDAADRPLCQVVRMDPATFAAPPADPCAPGSPAGGFGEDRVTRNGYSGSKLIRTEKAVGTSLRQDYVAYTYTQNNRIATVTDANGALAAYGYDALDRRQRWYFPSKTTAGEASTTDYEDYSYDLAGNRTGLRKRDGQVIGYGYDPLNRMSVKDIPGGTAADVHYRYDNRGLRLRARFASIDGEGIDTVYDAVGRVTSATLTMDGVGRTLAYQYDPNGNRTRMSWPGGGYSGSNADRMDRPLTVNLNGSTTVASYTYNAKGERVRQDRANGTHATFSYDPVSRLSGMVEELGGTSADVGYSFGFNPASQVTGRTRTNDAYAYGPEANVSRGYAVNGLNQYAVVGSTAFSYDADGNLTSDGQTSYAYDVENRLVSASGAQAATLRYDPAGRLYETSGGAAGTTRFLHDGDQLVAEYNSGGTLLRRYIHGAGVDDPLVRYEGTGTASPVYLSADHQGSITAQADADGNPVAVNAYTEWGAPKATNLGRFQYTGQAWIPELKLYHYKARVYSPGLGRFLQTDPVGYDDQVNLYAYAINDPLSRIDPSGEASWLVSRPIYGGLAHHAFVVVAESLGGNISARFSYGPSGGPAASILQQSSLVPMTGNGTATDIEDDIVWRSLGTLNSEEGVSFSRIDAPDNVVISEGKAMDIYLRSKNTIYGAFQGPNSNSAAFEIARKSSRSSRRSLIPPLGFHPGSGTNVRQRQNKSHPPHKEARCDGFTRCSSSVEFINE